MLRERITIRRRAETKNAGGGLDISWSTLASRLAAQVTNFNAREAVIGGVLQGVSYFDIMVRFRTDLKPSDQVLWNGRELNVISAEDRLGTRQWTMIQASTAAPQGA
jgi:head-tail adaptor